MCQAVSQALGLGCEGLDFSMGVERAAIDPSPGEGPGLTLTGPRLDLRRTASGGDVKITESTLVPATRRSSHTHSLALLLSAPPPSRFFWFHFVGNFSNCQG